jgi:hypothetical protein
VVGYRAHPGLWEGAIRILYWSSTVLMIAYISLALGYLMGLAAAIPIVMTSRSTEPSLKRAVLNYEEQVLLRTTWHPLANTPELRRSYSTWLTAKFTKLPGMNERIALLARSYYSSVV